MLIIYILSLKVKYIVLFICSLLFWGQVFQLLLTMQFNFYLNFYYNQSDRSNPYGVRDTVEQTPEVLPVTRVVLGRELDCTGGAAGRVQKLAFGRR